MSYQVRRLRAGDLPSVTEIYNAACRARESTQGMRPWSVKEMEEFITESHLGVEAYTCASNGAVVGWAAFTPYRVREDVRHTAEMSIYVQHSARRKGVGCALVRTLLNRAKILDLHCVLAMTFEDTPDVVSFIEKHAFSRAGCFPEIFSNGGKYSDILIFEKLITVADRRRRF
ncbi:GNAT family N-acetyltransferase [Bradyrhizobium sp. WSM471]|uniref:GNAT family N-acetyltransferase n=1 Tax=Bradyrhizobium sp. WSM471 TaxID=319017 RepID=UPI00024D235E|nr:MULTISPECIES: GNAT family N-acetyltransferase [Bradyrhizobium]EHR00848.1 sortase-like acyltransferase [Bradyrhizobium sp. WSM471]UFW42929.1 GNAT family N-acetyltransferase [Bradyrhizobium canariense]